MNSDNTNILIKAVEEDTGCKQWAMWLQVSKAALHEDPWVSMIRLSVFISSFPDDLIGKAERD